MASVLDEYERMDDGVRIQALLDAVDEMIQSGDDKKEKRVKWLYDVLTILDNKTAHLLRLNSILLAAQSFLIGTMQLSDLNYGVRVLLVGLLLVPFIGIFYALQVFGVAWPFLPWKLEIKGISRSFDEECRALARRCSLRTIEHSNVRTFTRITVFGAFLLLLIVGGILLSARGGVDPMVQREFDALSAADRALVEMARAARKGAYAPYSKFLVGAAARSRSGATHCGANMENASYGLTMCAEVGAITRSVAEGDFQLEAIAVIGGPLSGASTGIVAPCGRCRQLLLEASHVSGVDIQVLSCSADLKQIVEAPISELLPLGFGPDDLK